MDMISGFIYSSMAKFLNEEENGVLFRKGTVISIKSHSLFEPVLNVIQKIEGDNVYFRIPEEFLRNNIFKGEKLICQVIQDKHEFVIEGKISNIDVQYPGMVELFVEKISKFRNKRASKRYNASFHTIVSSASMERRIYAITKNISLSGVGLIFKENIDVPSVVGLKVSVNIRTNEVLEFNARIIRSVAKNGYNEYGLEIISIDDKNRDLLDKVIYQLNQSESAYIAQYLK